MRFYADCWKPHGESFEEYCGGAGDCNNCPIGNRCGMREKVEEDEEEG